MWIVLHSSFHNFNIHQKNFNILLLLILRHIWVKYDAHKFHRLDKNASYFWTKVTSVHNSCCRYASSLGIFAPNYRLELWPRCSTLHTFPWKCLWDYTSWHNQNNTWGFLSVGLLTASLTSFINYRLNYIRVTEQQEH